jgi:hypothetical protein
MNPITGTLTHAGTMRISGDELTGVFIRCTMAELADVERFPFGERVAVVAENATAQPTITGNGFASLPAAELDALRLELDAYRQGGVTEEILRRNDGAIKVGNGCVIALASELEELRKSAAAHRTEDGKA